MNILPGECSAILEIHVSRGTFKTSELTAPFFICHLFQGKKKIEMVEKVLRTKMSPKLKVERDGTIAINSD